MPIPEGPDGGGVPTIWTMNSDGSDIANRQPTLVEVADRLEKVEPRWIAIKSLRVARAKYHDAISMSEAAALGAWYEHYGDPRLTAVAAKLGVLQITTRPWHLDVDWFGPAGMNWWDSGPNGSVLQRLIAGGLLHALEESLGLPWSDPSPASWKWAANGGPSPLEGLKSDPPAVAEPPRLLLQWQLDQDRTTFAVKVIRGPLGILIRTPYLGRHAL